MTKLDCMVLLRRGERIDRIFPLRDGQECTIYKADAFVPGLEIIYIPDIDLNAIPYDKDLSADIEGIMDFLCQDCYTGDDFIDLCDGDTEKAKRLFEYVDWQHPSSALEAGEIEDYEEDGND